MIKKAMATVVLKAVSGMSAFPEMYAARRVPMSSAFVTAIPVWRK
jgi:hypothetical protein